MSSMEFGEGIGNDGGVSAWVVGRGGARGGEGGRAGGFARAGPTFPSAAARHRGASHSKKGVGARVCGCRGCWGRMGPFRVPSKKNPCASAPSSTSGMATQSSGCCHPSNPLNQPHKHTLCLHAPAGGGPKECRERSRRGSVKCPAVPLSRCSRAPWRAGPACQRAAQ